jgi:tRNA (guanine37-N1)-methyltransferase
LAAMVFMDAIVRQLPGVLGHKDSAAADSFADGLLDCPHYTRPEAIDGLTVPKVLTCGDHDAIERWRMQQKLGRTWQQRRDLLENLALTTEQEQFLAEFIRLTKESGG